jgi:hypothetical protein
MDSPSRRSFLRGAAALGVGVVSGRTLTTQPAPAATTCGTTDTTTGRADVRSFRDVQAAFDSGKPLIIPAGVTVGYAGPYLKVDPGLDLQVDGVLEKTGSPQGGGTTRSFLRNRDFGAPVDDVTIHGTGVIRAASQKMTCNLFAMSGDRIHLDSFAVTCWAGGRCMILAGDDITLTGLGISGSPQTSNNGGIRYAGGNNFLAQDCNVVSGDDALQFVPLGSPSAPLFDRTITNGRYLNCTGRSYSARFAVVGLQGRSTGDRTDITMTASVSDVTFDNCDGVGGICATRVQNISSSGVISNVVYNDCQIDMGPSTAKVLGTEFLIDGEPATGGVDGVHGDVHILHPRTRLERIEGKTANIDVSVTNY